MQPQKCLTWAFLREEMSLSGLDVSPVFLHHSLLATTLASQGLHVYPSPEANWACHWLAELEGLCFSRYLWVFLETFKWKSFSFAVNLFPIPWFYIIWDWGWLLLTWSSYVLSKCWSILFAQDVSRIKMTFLFLRNLCCKPIRFFLCEPMSFKFKIVLAYVLKTQLKNRVVCTNKG